MRSIDIKNNIITLKDMQLNQLESVLHLYNTGEYYKYAFGTDSLVTVEMLEARYYKMMLGDNEYFLGIHSQYEDRIIGIISGKLAGRILWINVLAIGSEYQGKGYGSVAVCLLLDHFMNVDNVKEVYLAVADKNSKGRKFWLNNGFCELKNVNSKALYTGNEYNVIIMQKRL